MEEQVRTSEPTVVAFDGQYDVSCKKRLRTLLDRLSHAGDLVLDFSRVTFIDSTCVTELLRMHARRVEKRLPQETIVMGQTPIRRLFEVLDLYRVFRIVPSIDEALGTSEPYERIEFVLGRPT